MADKDDDWKDTNVGAIGSAEDHAARKAAADTEEAWKGAGTKAGLWIWRIEQFKVVVWTEDKFGTFYSGDSYIILHTENATDESGKKTDKLIQTIHYWQGKDSSIDERGVSAYKTVELDDYFDGIATQVREVQGHESEAFLKLFKRIEYLDGGVESGFRKRASLENVAFQKKLFKIKKTKADGVKATEVLRDRGSLNQGDGFILDCGEKIYVWYGNKIDPPEKLIASQWADKLEGERNPKPEVIYDIDDTTSDFWDSLGGEGEIKEEDQGDVPPTASEGNLYKLIFEGEALVMKEVGHGDLGAGQLDTNHVMMVDTMIEIFIWIGAKAAASEIKAAMTTADDYLSKNNRGHGSGKPTPIYMFKETQPIKPTTEHAKRWLEIFKSGPKTTHHAPPPRSSTLERVDKEAKEAPPMEKQYSEPSKKSVPRSSLMSSSKAEWEALGVDPSKREQYLDDKEFEEAFKMTKAEFEKLPKWKQQNKKKELELF